MRIFLHSISLKELDPRLAQHDPALQGKVNEYSERSVLLAAAEDYVLLNRKLDPAYSDYLSELGFGIGQHLVPAAIGESLAHKVQADADLVEYLRNLCAKFPGSSLQPYLSTEVEIELARAIGADLYGPSPDLNRTVNNKIWFRSAMASLGLPSTNGVVATASELMDRAKALLDRHSAVIVRGQASCGGSSVWPIRSQAELEGLRERTHGAVSGALYLVEQLYEVQSSPNAQFHIGHDKIIDVGISDQTLGYNLAHKGNTYPAATSRSGGIIETGHKICSLLGNLGYIGLAGVDFIITKDDHILPVEVNARVNTSSFAFKVLEQLYGKRGKTKRFKLITGVPMAASGDFKALKRYLGNALLRPGHMQDGVFPYNAGCLQWQKYDAILIADDPSRIEDYEHLIRGNAARPLEGTYD